MKLTTLALMTLTGMTATSVAVWSTTGGSTTKTAAASEPSPQTASPDQQAAVDQSTFTAGETLMMEGRLGHAVVPTGVDTETFVFVDVKANATRTAVTAPPLNLAVVIDRSGSMKGKRMRNALAAARTSVERLREGDMITVVAYDTRTELVVPKTRITASNRDDVIRRLQSMRARGDTCISCGVQAGMRVLGEERGKVNRILLLSDGEATAGIRDITGFERLAESCRSMGASITTIGVDVDYNEQIMAALARESNGRHFFAESSSALVAVFDQEMASLATTVAIGAELTIDLAPGVFAEHVFNRSFTRSGNRVVVPMGSFAADDNKTLLMRLRVPRGPEGERPIAAVHLNYDNLAEGGAGHCEGSLVAMASADPAEVSPLDGLVSARVTRSETAQVLTEANELFARGRGDDARQVLRRQRARLQQGSGPARTAAPAARRKDVDQAFETSSGAIDEAESGFAKAPAPDDRGGKAQVRDNTKAAFDLEL